MGTPAVINIIERDLSVIMTASKGVTGAIVLPANWGEIDKARLITVREKFLAEYLEPDLSLGVGHFDALTFLNKSNALYVARTAHDTRDGELPGEDPRYSAVLVRGKIDPLPDNIMPPEFLPDPVVMPYQKKLSKYDLARMSFDLYKCEREYLPMEDLFLKDNVTASNKIQLNLIDGLAVGDLLAFPVVSTTPGQADNIYEIKEAEVKAVKLDKVKLDRPAFTKSGDSIRRVVKKWVDIDPEVTLSEDALQGTKTLKVTAVDSLAVGQTISFGDSFNPDNGKYVITAISEDDLEVKLKTPVLGTVSQDTKLILEKREYYPYSTGPYSNRDFDGSNEILVNNSDQVGNGDYIAIGAGLSSDSNEYTVLEKDIYVEDQAWVVLDKKITMPKTNLIYKMTKSEYEHRDCFLVYAKYQSTRGDNISIAIAPSPNFDDAFFINVYFKGVLSESWEVSRKHRKDGFGNNMYLEDKINGASDYIKVLDNPLCVDDNGEPMMPLYTNFSVWRKKESDIFLDSTAKVTEDLIWRDTEIRVDSHEKLPLGGRVKFGSAPEEYKIVNKSLEDIGGTIHYFITLDRGIKPDKIPVESPVLLFDHIQYEKFTKLKNVYYNYKRGAPFTLAGEDGYLSDAGANMAKGGHNGSAVTIGDYMRTLHVYDNPEEIRINLLMDGGFANVPYAQALTNLCENRQDSFAYLSVPESVERKSDYLGEILKYKQSLNMNSSYCSLFTPRCKIYDEYNQKEVWVSPTGFAAACQSFTHINYDAYFPAAGWTRGSIKVLDVLRNFNRGDREFLAQNCINPIRRHSNLGVAIWGNETLVPFASALQLRSVRMLLIKIEVALRDFLETIHFEPNTVAVRERVTSVIDQFMKYEIKDGVYAYQVTCNDANNSPQDIDSRRLNVFLGIKPTRDIAEINAIVGIFATGMDFKVVS